MADNTFVIVHIETTKLLDFTCISVDYTNDKKRKGLYIINISNGFFTHFQRTAFLHIL